MTAYMPPASPWACRSSLYQIVNEASGREDDHVLEWIMELKRRCKSSMLYERHV